MGDGRGSTDGKRVACFLSIQKQILLSLSLSLSLSLVVCENLRFLSNSRRSMRKKQGGLFWCMIVIGNYR